MKCCIQKCSYLGPKSHFKLASNLSATLLQRLAEQNLVVPEITHICEKHWQLLNPPTYEEQVKLEEQCYIPDYMFQIASRDETPETFGDLEALPDYDDFIIDLFYLKMHYKNRIGQYLKNWCFAESLNTAMFFLLEPADIPSIYVSIKLDIYLKVTVSLDGRLMDLRDMTCFIPMTGKITRWSQLETILTHYARKQTKANKKLHTLSIVFVPPRF